MKDRIARACTDLLRTRSVDEITVCDIAKSCGISRQTFYYYFENIESVVMYSVECGLEILEQTCIQTQDPKEVLRIIIISYRNQYDLLKHLLQSKSRPRVSNYYYEILYVNIKTHLEKYRDRYNFEPGELEMAASFFAYGLGGLLYKRCEEPDLDVEQFTDEVYRFIGKHIIKSVIIREE